jgi:hypothetical protein
MRRRIVAKSKQRKRKILMPVGTPSIPLEEIRRAVQKVKAEREERERAADSANLSSRGARQVTTRAKPKRTVPKPKGTPSFSYEEAKRVIDRIMAAEREKKRSSRNSR